MFRLLQPYRKGIMQLIKLIMLLANLGIFAYTFYRFYSEASVYIKGSLAVVLIYAVTLYAMQRLYDAFEFGYTPTWELAYSGSLGILISAAVAYIMICLIANKSFLYVSVWPLMVAGLFQIALFTLGSWMANKVYGRLFPARRLIAFCTPQDEEALAKFASMPQRYQICEVIAEERITPGIWNLLDQYEAVFVGSVSPELRMRLMAYCYNSNKRVYLSPLITDILVRNAASIQVSDSLVFLCRNRGLSLEQRFLKRALDITIALVALIPALPLMAITALAIKLQDGGPVLYKQTRLTKDARPFEVYKFRSMITDAEKDGVARLACEGDDRITPVGRIIRKIRFDELPQIFNILKGDMSLVGPRPERPEIIEEYTRQMPEFNYRLKVKAGLTGYAQVWGRYNTTPQEKLKLDLMYIENYSLVLDIKLMLLTLKILFMPSSSQGIQQGTILPTDIVFKKHEDPALLYQDTDA